MKIYIEASVGRNGKNLNSDVRIVQTLINFKAERNSNISRLKVDGISGPKTKKSIGQVQRHIAGVRSPDFRIDPGRRTEKILADSLTAIQIKQIKKLQNKSIATSRNTISNVTQPDNVSCGYYAA